jgi:hypothetical protein
MAVIHCWGHQKGDAKIAWENWKANREAKQAALTTSTVLMAALLPCSLAEWDPLCTPQEQAQLKTEEGNSLLYVYWKFADGCIAISESLAATFVKQFHEGAHSGQTLLETTLVEQFFVPKLSSISKVLCERCAKNSLACPRIMLYSTHPGSPGITVYQDYYRVHYRKKNSCTCNDTMKIQTLTSRWCFLTLGGSEHQKGK